MNHYKIETICSIYGKSIFYTKAFTPFDAAEKAANILSWREKEDILKQEVMIQDGSKETWIFENKKA